MMGLSKPSSDAIVTKQLAFELLLGKPLAFYSGCDRWGSHLYKFVSRDSVRNPTDQANSRLLHNGMLYAAKFNSEGSGR